MPIHQIHQTPSPYNAGELAELDYEQTADILYLAHENHAPTKLVRSSHYSWAFTEIAFAPTISAPTGLSVTATVANTDSANSGNAYAPQTDNYVVTAYNEDTGQESRASTADDALNDLGLKRNFNTLTWNAVAGATGYRIYKKQEKQEYGYIGTTTETSFIDRNIGPDLSEGPPVGDNPFAAAGDYPGSITFHEQRSFWGRTINNPNAIYGSRSADYENMDFRRPQREDDGFVIGLVANKVNAVNQLVSTKQGLLALTSHNIFTVQGANEDYIAANPPPRVRPEIHRGCSRLNPITVDNVVFYETAKGSSVHTIGYQFDLDGIRTDDLTVFARHLFENQDIVDWAFLEKPGSMIIAPRGDGEILCLTWDQAQEVWGWTHWDTGPLTDDGTPRDKFEGVCTINEGGEDRAYYVVRRVIDGVERLYIERSASDQWQDQADACYLDSARTFVNTTATADIGRLDHLEGEEVYALIDGNVAGPFTVADGSITLPYAGLVVTVGLRYTALIETLPLAIQTSQGWSIARDQQANHVVLRVIKTRGILVGVEDDDLLPVKDRFIEGYGDATDLLTGDYVIDLPAQSADKRETNVIIASEDPLPMHIAAVLPEPAFGEG
jgi:hypothetical protein